MDEPQNSTAFIYTIYILCTVKKVNVVVDLASILQITSIWMAWRCEFGNIVFVSGKPVRMGNNVCLVAL
jgi:uncharacterized membrane protein